MAVRSALRRERKLSRIAIEAQVNTSIAGGTRCVTKSRREETKHEEPKSVRSRKLSKIGVEALSNEKAMKSATKNQKTEEKVITKPPAKRPESVFTRKSRTVKVPSLSSKITSLSKHSESKLKSKSLRKREMQLNAFQKAIQVLHSSAIPSNLPCRENEFLQIYNFIKGKLLEESGGCIYVSGVPGTGKTATVYEAIRNLRNESEKSKEIPKFKFVEVNGLRLTDPYQCYVQIHYTITGRKTGSQTAATALDKRFTNPSKDENEPIVLLVDELDLLCTRKQSILYHLFEWPNKPRSNLIVISIANAMDLPERVMMNRVASRLGLSRLTFQPYNHNELREILESRLEGLDAFSGDGLQLIARKVAAISGDARRALDICRRAIEIAESALTDDSSEYYVTMKHVDKALQEIFSSPKLMAIRNASSQEQIFLQSIVQDFRLTGLEEATFVNVYRHHVSHCKFEGIHTPSDIEVLDIAYSLFDTRLILIDNNQVYLYKRIRLQVSVEDVMFALKIKK